MSFAGILGAGLLGGAGSAAKGAGDRLREEAKQKREQALQLQIKEDNAAQQIINQEDALLLADRQSENKIKELQAQGLVTKDVNDAGAVNQSNLLAQKGDISTAQSILNASLNQETTSVSQQGAAIIEAAQLKLKAQLKLGDNANLAELQAAQAELEAALTAIAVETKVITDAGVTATATSTAGTVASTLAATNATAAMTQAEVNAEAARQLAITNAERATNLGLVQMEQLTANNAAALERIRAGKVGDVHTFFDANKGLEYKAIMQEDGTFKMEGGTKAPSASKGSYTLQSIKLEGKDVTGYMDGKTWVTVGGVADKDKDIGGASGSGYDEKSAEAYFTKQAYAQLNVKFSELGVLLGDVEKTDYDKARKWIAVAVDRWRGMQGSESPGEIVAEVFNDAYHHQLKEPTPSVRASAKKALDNGVDKAALKKQVEEQGFDSSFLD